MFLVGLTAFVMNVTPLSRQFLRALQLPKPEYSELAAGNFADNIFHLSPEVGSQESNLKPRCDPAPKWAPLVPPYAIGTVAIFWVIQRSAAFQQSSIRRNAILPAGGLTMGWGVSNRTKKLLYTRKSVKSLVMQPSAQLLPPPRDHRRLRPSGERGRADSTFSISVNFSIAAW